MSGEKKSGVLHIIQEFSIPLIAGVICALIAANVDYETYKYMVNYPVFGLEMAGHAVTVHWLINDIFMVFFFGIAAKEITESVLPGGSLNPPSKAVNPLLGTIGGVVGPVGVYFLLTAWLYPEAMGAYPESVAYGWGIPTATDIALAWLVARLIFGASHPAVNFLLLLAVADDAIGLGIIAIVYPSYEPSPEYLLYLTVPGMIISYILRKRNVQAWLPYILFGGVLSWLGFLYAHLHPALALVPIVPFLPGPSRDTGMFESKDEVDEEHEIEAAGGHVEVHHDHSPLHNFEHELKLPVDFGLFFFGFANAGVALSSVSPVTWIVLASLIAGKTIGITFFSYMGTLMGAKLPEGMNIRHLIVAGIVAGLGLTVALFVAGQAFKAPGLSEHMGPAKMGALLSAGAALVAFIAAKAMGIKPQKD